MTRLAAFFQHQRAAFRALFATARPSASRELREPDAPPPHPSTLCDCGDAVTFVDHRPDCPWAAVMCHACAGWGWCLQCAGTGAGAHHGDGHVMALRASGLPPLSGR